MKTRNALGGILAANCDGPLFAWSRFNISGRFVVDKYFLRKSSSEPCSQTEKMISVAAYCKHPGLPQHFFMLRVRNVSSQLSFSVQPFLILCVGFHANGGLQLKLIGHVSRRYYGEYLYFSEECFLLFTSVGNHFVKHRFKCTPLFRFFSNVFDKMAAT